MGEERKDICEEIDAGWDTRRNLYVLRVGGVCDEIDTGWDAESRVVWISSSREKWERGEIKERKGVCEEIDARWGCRE